MTRSTTSEQWADKAATAFRATHRLADAPIHDLFELVHASVAIDAFSINAHESEHGLTVRDAVTGRVAIVVATTRHPLRQRSSLAHELGHVLAQDLGKATRLVPGRRTAEEVRADTFARHLLLPVKALESRLARKGSVTPVDVSDLVQEFGISPYMAAIQLKETGLITAAECREWSAISARTLAATHGWLSQYDTLAEASQRPRAPQSLMARAAAAYQRGLLGLTELSLWYGTDPEGLVTELGQPTHVPESEDESDWGLDTPLFGTSA